MIFRIFRMIRAGHLEPRAGETPEETAGRILAAIGRPDDFAGTTLIIGVGKARTVFRIERDGRAGGLKATRVRPEGGRR